jgi:hypothetical protein
MFAPATIMYTHGPGLRLYTCIMSEVCDLNHVTYSFINMLFISMEIIDDKLRPQILSVGITANSPLIVFNY